MRLSRQQRDEAATICGIAGSGGIGGGGSPDARIYSRIRTEIDPDMDNQSYVAAMAVWTEVRDHFGSWWIDVDRECEALLRSGWNPGNPVVRR